MSCKNVRIPEDSDFLVTGGAGFTESILCEAPLDMGQAVRCLDDLSFSRQANVGPYPGDSGYTFVRGDMRDPATCLPVMDGVDYALHQDIQPTFGAERPAEIRHSSAGFGKARRLLGYDPSCSFAAGMKLPTQCYVDCPSDV